MSVKGVMHDFEILHSEDNLVSLSSAFVVTDARLVALEFMPGSLESSIPVPREGSHTCDVTDCAWLYRRLDSNARRIHDLLEEILMPRSFPVEPKFEFMWSCAGTSVAVTINGEPWAFLEENTRRGHSKGVLAGPEQWDEELFRSIFGIPL